VKGRACARAGVLHVENGNGLEAHGAQRDLAAHHGLPFERALRGVGEKGRFDVGHGQTRVRERRVHGVGRELLDALVEELAGRRHADAGNVNGRLGVAHGGLLSYKTIAKK